MTNAVLAHECVGDGERLLTADGVGTRAHEVSYECHSRRLSNRRATRGPVAISVDAFVTDGIATPPAAIRVDGAVHAFAANTSATIALAVAVADALHADADR